MPSLSLLPALTFYTTLLFSQDRASASVLDLGTLGGTYSFARDINHRGEIVGESTTASGDTHAFCWKGGALIDLGSLEGHSFSMANGNNNIGQVVGYARASAKHGAAKAMLWETDGRAVILPNVKGESYSQASDINDKGEIAGVSGTKAVLWKQGKAISLKPLGGEYSIALSLNNKGWVVGNSHTKDGEVHASLWRDGKVIDLGTLGGRFSTANGVNDRHQIVGSSETDVGHIHAFLWENGSMKDLGPGMIRALNATGILGGESPLYEDKNGFATTQAVQWTANKDEVRLDNLSESKYSSVFGINNHGTAVGVTELYKPKDAGSSDDDAAGIFHATLWAPTFAAPSL